MRTFTILYTLLLTLGLSAQDNPNFSIRASGAYQFFSLSGQRTNSNSFGGVLEKRTGYTSSFGLNVQYITRNDDAEYQRRNASHYNNVVHFTPFFRKYFDEAFSGPYSGVGFGIGIPENTGVQTELGGHFGYVITKNTLVIDIGIQTGFGALRYSEETYGSRGNYLGSTFYADYGFFFRPGVSIGFGK